MTNPQRPPAIYIHHGAVVKFTEDDTIEAMFLIGQYADNLGKRFSYYEVKYHPRMTYAECVAMIEKVKEVIR